TGEGVVVVPLGFEVPGHKFDPLVGALARLTGGPALPPGNNTLDGTDGTSLQVFASVVTDVAHHLDLVAGNDTVTSGAGSDVLVGDDFTLMAPLLTLTPASQTTLLGLTGDARDAAESFGDFMERLDEAGSEPDGGEHHQTVVVDATLSVGNDTLTS